MQDEKELRPRSAGHRNQAQVLKTQFRYGLTALPAGARVSFTPGTRAALMDEHLAAFFEDWPHGVTSRGPILKAFLAEGHPVREHLLKSGYARRYASDPVELENRLRAAISGFLSMMVKQHLYDSWRGTYRGCAVWTDPVQTRGDTITKSLSPDIPGLEDEMSLDAAIAAEEDHEEADERLADQIENKRGVESDDEEGERDDPRLRDLFDDDDESAAA